MLLDSKFWFSWKFFKFKKLDITAYYIDLDLIS